MKRKDIDKFINEVVENTPIEKDKYILENNELKENPKDEATKIGEELVNAKTPEEILDVLNDVQIKTNGEPLEECKPPMLDCANDLHISVKKYPNEFVLDQDCCTALTIILKNDGDLACSFMGAHNLSLVKLLEKSWKKYFKGLKKALKKEQKDKTIKDEIQVLKDNNNECINNNTENSDNKN